MGPTLDVSLSTIKHHGFDLKAFEIKPNRRSKVHHVSVSVPPDPKNEYQWSVVDVTAVEVHVLNLLRILSRIVL